MVECETSSAEFQEVIIKTSVSDGSEILTSKFTAANYPETWFFQVFRSKGRLACLAYGHSVEESMILSARLTYQDKEWVLDSMKSLKGDGVFVDEAVKREFWRQFAAFKARYLAGKRRGSGVRINMAQSAGPLGGYKAG